MDQIKDRLGGFQVIEDIKQEFKETFPDTPESSPDKEDHTNFDQYEDSSDDDNKKKKFHVQ